MWWTRCARPPTWAWPRDALDAPPDPRSHGAPIATVIDAIPGIASVGLGEAEARAAYGDIQVGTACYSDVARSRIVGLDRGRLKLIADPKAERLLGAHIVGDQAGEMIAIAQVAIMGGLGPQAFIDTIFAFPTFAEAYCLAAQDLMERRQRPALRGGPFLGQLLPRKTPRRPTSLVDDHLAQAIATGKARDLVGI